MCYIYLSIYMRVQHSDKICYLRQIRYSFHVGEYSNKIKRSKRRSVNRSFYRRRELSHVDNTIEQVETSAFGRRLSSEMFSPATLLFFLSSVVLCLTAKSTVRIYTFLTRLIVRTLITHFRHACTLFSVPSTIAWL